MVGVRQPNGLTFTFPFPEDTEVVNVMVVPPAPTGIDLLNVSDSGASNTDNVTRSESLQFNVTGVIAGATVKLRAGNIELGEAIVAAGENSVVITTTKLAEIGDGIHSVIATQVLAAAESPATAPLQVTLDRQAPGIIPGVSLPQAFVGQAYAFDFAHPQEGVSLTYAATTFPAGLSITPQTGQIAWTPKVDQSGNQALTLQYTDLAGNTTTQDFSIDVQVVTYVDLVAFAKRFAMRVRNFTARFGIRSPMNRKPCSATGPGTFRSSK